MASRWFASPSNPNPIPDSKVVQCTITQQLSGVKVPLCAVTPRCVVTSHHPVWLPNGDTWQLPHAITQPREEPLSTLYNFVLAEPQHAVLVDGVRCITLGHGLSQPEVKHPVWGGNAILRYLEAQPGYPAVVLDGLLAVADVLQYADSSGGAD